VRCVVLGGTDHSLLPRAMQDEFIALVEAQALRMASPPAAMATQAIQPVERARRSLPLRAWTPPSCSAPSRSRG
jgi:hypothetical protein